MNSVLQSSTHCHHIQSVASPFDTFPLISFSQIPMRKCPISVMRRLRLSETKGPVLTTQLVRGKPGFSPTSAATKWSF